MSLGKLASRKQTARVLVNIAAPIIDDYLRFACKLPLYSNHSAEEIAALAAPRFVELIMIYDEPLWPDFPDLILAAVVQKIVKLVKVKRRFNHSKVEESRIMSRPKGLPKTGGRKRGVRNLKTLVLRESLDRVGFDIVQELYDLYPKLDPEIQAKILMSFLQFLFPKPTAVPIADLRTYEMYKKADTAIFGNLDGGPEIEDESDNIEA